MTATQRPASLTRRLLLQNRRDGIAPGVNLAASWAERALVLVAATWFGTLLLWRLALVVVPFVSAVLLAALLMPVVHLLAQFGIPRSEAALVVLIVAAMSCAVLLATAVRQGGLEWRRVVGRSGFRTRADPRLAPSRPPADQRQPYRRRLRVPRRAQSSVR